MPYSGKTYIVPCDGGWTPNPNTDLITVNSMLDVNSINIHKGGRQPRGGCDTIATITSTPATMGIYQFFKETGSPEDYVVDENADNLGDEDGNMWITSNVDFIEVMANGKIYQNHTTEIKSGWTENTKAHFESFYNKLYISNGVGIPQVWENGSSYTWDIGSPKKPTAALGSGAGNVDDGTHSYQITFVTASGESTGGVTSAVVTVADHTVNGKVNLSSIPTGPSSVTSRKIYRTVAGDTGDYLLVDTISDNTTTTYEDNTADAGLGAAAPSTSTALIPTSWNDNYPKYFIKHGRGASKRLWAFGCPDTPNYAYASANGEEDFSDDNVIAIQIMTETLVGAVEFGATLFFASRSKTYLIDDTALSTTNWGYQVAPWEGGVAHHELIVKTPTDVLAMDESGEIISIGAAEEYGDYKLASLVRPSYIDKWIENNVDLTQVDKFHAEYDLQLRMIKIFVVLKGNDYPDTALVYVVDKGPSAGWTKHSFEVNHLCSTLVRVSQSNWKIYTGDEGGKIYSLESDTLLDGTTGYDTDFTLPPMSFGDPRMDKCYDAFHVALDPQGTETLDINHRVDNRDLTATSITVAGADTDIENYRSDIGVTGKRIKTKISNDANEDYFISQLMYDVRELGY